MALALVATCNSATFQPMALAFGDSLSNAALEKNNASTEDGTGEETLASGNVAEKDRLLGDASSGTNLQIEETENDVADLNGVVSGGSNQSATQESPAKKDAPILKNLQGSLRVFVSFAGNDAASAEVELQLQRQSRAWDASAHAWGAWTQEWVSFGDPVVVSADDVTKAQADETAAYCFEKLAVQTVVGETAQDQAARLDSQFRYRVLESKIDGRAVAYEAEPIEGVLTGKASSTEAKTNPSSSNGEEEAVQLDAPEAHVAAGYNVKLPAAAVLAPEKADSTACTEAELAEAKAVVDNVAIAIATAPAARSLTANAVSAITYKVETTSFNNGDGTLEFGMSAHVPVVVYNANGGVVSSDTTNVVSVPSGGYFSIDASNLAANLEVTLTDYPNKGAADVSAMVKNPKNGLTVVLSLSNPNVRYVVQQPADKVTLQKTWNDNEDENKLRPKADDFKKLLSLEYLVEGSDTWMPLNDANKKNLGYTTLPSVEADAVYSSINFATWGYSFAKKLNHLNIEGKTVTYRLAEDASMLQDYVVNYVANDGSAGAQAADKVVLKNTAKVPYTATKIWKDSFNAYGTRLDDAAWLEQLTLHRSVHGETASVKVDLTTTEKNAEGYIEITDEEDGSRLISIPNALGYDDAGVPFSYFLTEDIASGAKGMPVNADADVSHKSSWYVPVYTNKENYASFTDGLYAKGTLENTLTNDYVFTGTKIWADDCSEDTRMARPDAEWVLYRYPKDGEHDYQSASPVATPSVKLNQKEKDTQTVTYPVDGAAALPRYDIDGHEYVYFVKETLGSSSFGYKQVHKNAKPFSDEKGSDVVLFDQGTLTNLRYATTNLDATKTWIAAAMADLKSEVTLSLFRSEVKYDSNGDPVVNNAGEYVYSDPAKMEGKDQVLDAFSAEFMSQTVSFSGLEQYDAHGLPYKYEARETGIKTNTVDGMQPVSFIKGSDVRFVTYDGHRYHQETVVDGITGRIEIRNILEGDAEVDIKKTFPDGIIRGNTTISYEVLQDGLSIGTIDHTYTDNSGTGKYTYDPDSSDHAVNKYEETLTIKEYEQLSNSTATGKLPRYSPVDGHEYRYKVVEKTISPSGYGKPTYSFSHKDDLREPEKKPSYDNEHYLRAEASVINPVTGPGKSITVKKEWIDDFDLACRGDVVVGVYDPKGVRLIAKGTIHPSEDRVEIAIPKNDRDYNLEVSEFVVKEISVQAPGKEAQNVVQKDDGKLKEEDFLKTHSPELGFDPGNAWVGTDNHEYAVSVSATPDSEGAWVVTNRRIGTLTIDLAKKWVDGSQHDKRPDYLSFKVTTDNANYTEPFEIKMTKDASGSDPNAWSAKSKVLPKYDRTGKVIHYTVEEETTSEKNGQEIDIKDLDYQVSSENEYKIGPINHTEDTLSYKFTNKLSGSVTPVVNKYWKDDDRLGITRPDIVPVLYEKFQKPNPNDPSDPLTVAREVTRYVDRDWFTQLEKGEGHWWRCEFDAMPKYTEDGFEITYAIGEKIDVPGEFGYKAFYEDSPKEDGTFSEFVEGTQKDETTFTLVAEDGKGTPVGAAPINGTIVNKLKADRTLSGLKIWKDMPTGVGKNWYPKVEFGLYKKSLDQSSIAPLQTTTIENGATAFIFAVPVQKYDAEGKMIEYEIKETMSPELGVAFDVEAKVEQTGIEVSNTFNLNQGYTVVFDKAWKQMATGLEGNKRPSVELTLVRYMKTHAANEYDESTRSVVEKTIITYDGNQNAQSVQWEDLPYYAPNGVPYQYRIEEAKLNGYQAAHENNEATVSGSYTSGSEGEKGSGRGTAEETNTYNGGREIALNVEKKWSDSQYNLSPKPDEVKMIVHRKTADGAFDEPVTKDLALRQANGWAYSVGAGDLLEKLSPKRIAEYAPNGQPYIYYLTEIVPDGYKFSSGMVTPANNQTSSNATVSATNTIEKHTLSAVKAWKKTVDDVESALTKDEILFASSLNAMPKSLTYQVEYSTDSGANWQVLKKGKDPVFLTSKLLEGAYETVSLTDLPAKTLVSGTPTPVRYRAVEYSASFKGGEGDEVVQRSDSTLGSSKVEETSSTSTQTTTTTIANTLPMKKLTLTKQWDDENNRDGYRPAKLAFDLVRTTCNKETDTQTTRIALAPDANAADKNTWTKAVNVPVYWNVNDEKQSSYASIEIMSDTLKAKYTTREVSSDGATYTSGETLEFGKDGAIGYFKNGRTGHDVFQATASKKWSAFSTSSYTGELKDLANKAYRPASLTFNLQFSTDGNNWDNSDASSREDRPRTLNGGDIQSAITVDLNSDGSLTTVPTWGQLPKRQDNSNVTLTKPYYYRVLETSALTAFAKSYSPEKIDGSASVSDASFEVTNTLETTSLAVAKTWNDSNNFYKTRPDAVNFKVQWSTDGATWNDVPSDGEWATLSKFSVNAAGNWAHTVSGLPKADAAGSSYRYRAVETALVYGSGAAAKELAVAEGNSTIYQASNNGVAGADGAVENVVESGGSISVEKTWDDGMNRDGKRPDSIVAVLQKRAKGSADEAAWENFVEKELSESNNWTWTWSNVPTYAVVDGAAIEQEYRVVEKSVPKGYDVAITSETKNAVTTFYMKNTHVPETVNVSVSKAWDDNSNAAGMRPASLKVTLFGTYKNSAGEDVKFEAGENIFSAQTGDEWTYTFEKLPVYQEGEVGKRITYSVEEDRVEGYELTYVDGNLLNMKNAMNTAMLSGSKVWKDQSDAYGLRPSAEDFKKAVKLYIRYTDQTEKEITNAVWNWKTEGNTWSYEIKGLQLPRAGATYVVKEEVPTSYSEAASGVAETSGSTGVLQARQLENTLQTMDLSVVKTWDDQGNAYSMRDAATVQLQQSSDGGATWIDFGEARNLDLQVESTETLRFEKLPVTAMVDGSRVVYQYRVTETPIEDYATVIGKPVRAETGETKEIAITNKLILVELAFEKVRLFAEACSDVALGADDPTETIPLADAEFTLFANEACTVPVNTVEGLPAKAKSDLDGKVLFGKLPATTYWMKETLAPSGCVLSDDVYVAVFETDGTLASFTKRGETTPVTQIVNDVHRADIAIKKVAETDEGKVLPGSTYGLYKRSSAQPGPEGSPASAFMRMAAGAGAFAVETSAEDGLRLIAKATTDKQGILSFKGVLMNEEYVIKELVAPDGSLVSEKPIAITFAVGENGKPEIASFDDGSGTAFVDESGNIVWREPQVVLSLEKRDPEGKLLAGARLQVVDAKGAVVDEPWVSSAENGHRLEGKLTAGETYQLVELEAPSGYAVAEPVRFTVENPAVGPGQNFVQHVVMVDQRLPETPLGSKLTSTGDNLGTAAFGALAVAFVGIVGTATAVRRRRR